MLAQGLRFLAQRRWQILWLFIGVWLPLIIFGHLAEEVLEQEDFRLDRTLLLGLQQWSNPWFGQVALLFRFLGGPDVLTPLSLVVVLYLLWLRRIRAALFFTLVMGGAVGLNLLAKAYFQRPRPDLFTPTILEPNYSFPSGHAMGSMAFTVAVVALLWPTRWRWTALVLAGLFVLLVAFSRIYLGAHYPSDVLGGWMASLAWGVGLSQILRPLVRAKAD